MVETKNKAKRLLFPALILLPAILLLGLRFSPGIFRFLTPGLGLVEPQPTAAAAVFVSPAPVDIYDGPYLFHETSQAMRVVQVQQQGNRFVLDSKQTKGGLPVTLTVHVDNADRDSFQVTATKKNRIPPSTYPPASKLLAISDIEGNFEAFSDLLLGNKVIDQQFNWIYGQGHLVLIGDFVDRGHNVIPCLWLIYKLEDQALRAGGRVHYVLGNHEQLNLSGNPRYLNPKYVETGKMVSGREDPHEALKYLMSNQSHLARWMRLKNVMEKVGRGLFLHGGVSSELLAIDMEIGQINNLTRKFINYDGYGKNLLEMPERVIFSSGGPFWYRGLIDYHPQEKADREMVVMEALRRYQVDYIVIGHTVVHTISSDFNGRVFRTDVRQPIQKNTGKAEALLIENGQFFRVNDRGERVKL